MISTRQIEIINAALLGYRPEKIGVFGSRARGESHELSDLDILVFFKNGKCPYSLFQLLKLEKKLETQLGFPVEIINERSIQNETMKNSILNDLRIIYE